LGKRNIDGKLRKCILQKSAGRENNRTLKTEKGSSKKVAKFFIKSRKGGEEGYKESAERGGGLLKIL